MLKSHSFGVVGILMILFFGCFLWLFYPQPSPVFLKLNQLTINLREKLILIYQKLLPEPEAGLLGGIVLGAKSALPKEFYQALQKTGTLHIVVASGYNLTVISQRPVDFLSWWFGRKTSLILGWILIWFYTLLTGAEPPIIRAAIIVSFVYLGQFLGKKIDVWRSFLTSAMIMILVKPSLISDISFQLSFGAMTGILALAPRLEKISHFPLVGKELTESLAAQIMVLPIIAYHFGKISWLSPLINMIVLPLIPFLMQFGLAGLIGAVWLPLALPFVFLCYPFLFFFVNFVSFWHQFDFIQFNFKFNLWLAIGYYLILWSLLVRKKTPNSLS